VEQEDDAVVLEVRDDGEGAEPEQLLSSYGVRGMRERALLIGGALSVSSQPDGGTEVTLAVPVKRWPRGPGSNEGVRPGGETHLR